MYPVLFEIFGFPISTFGVMLAIAFLSGTWLTALRMRDSTRAVAAIEAHLTHERSRALGL